MDAEIKNYISNRYERWLEFSQFQCAKRGIASQHVDIVNEVILQLNVKRDDYLLMLVRTPSKCGRYKELDVLVLRMIYLNIYSPTSPYQNKYKPIPANTEVDYRKLNIIDSEDEEIDKPAIMLEKFNQVREIFEQLHLSCRAKQVFEHRFINDLPFSEWKGTESTKQLYCIYTSVVKLIKKRLKGESLL